MYIVLSLYWDFLVLSLMIRLELWFRGGRLHTESVIFITSYQIYQHDLHC